MKYKNKSLVITTIAKDNNFVLKKYSKIAIKNKIQFVVIGDKKSPKNFFLNGIDYYSLKKQKKLNFKLAKILPINHYSRKNIGYLIAMQNKSDCIIETDDDNIPLKNFLSNNNTNQKTFLLKNKGWVNIYNFFSDKNIWPRGFALEELKKATPRKGKLIKLESYIQQGLADLNPDVDAIYRLTNKLPINFFKKINSVSLGNGSICPFNSQNTTWIKPAYPLMYLPSYCSFRMTDIWRSFVAQRVAWSCGWSIMFHKSSVFQKRNVHNLMNDFIDEIPGYTHNYKIMQKLVMLKLLPGTKNLKKNMLKCYKEFIKMNLINKREILLLNKWFEDIERINKNFNLTD